MIEATVTAILNRLRDSYTDFGDAEVDKGENNTFIDVSHRRIKGLHFIIEVRHGGRIGLSHATDEKVIAYGEGPDSVYEGKTAVEEMFQEIDRIIARYNA